MVNHFVNLVGWKKIAESCSIDHRVFIDSITMSMVVRLICGRGYLRVPGSTVKTKLASADGSSLVLVSRDYGGAKNDEEIYVVPFPLNDPVSYAHEIARIAIGKKSLFIGISSPKQNILASKVIDISPDLDIYCIGAVVDDYYVGRSIPDWCSRYHVEWLYRGIGNPKRMIFKVRETVLAIFELIVSSSSRSEFKLFIEAYANK